VHGGYLTKGNHRCTQINTDKIRRNDITAASVPYKTTRRISTLGFPKLIRRQIFNLVALR
jgi:hypothetical protein